jgi:chloramphenicol 3-O-phosphotransferase
LDEFKTFEFGEVGVVLDVERGEREFADEAAGRYPGVVRWPGSPAELGVVGGPVFSG